MRPFSIIVLVLAAIATVGAIVIRPEGEGFGRGWNVVAWFFLSTAVVWLATLAAAAVLLVRMLRRRACLEVLRGDRLATCAVCVGAAAPLLNALIVRALAD
jgi:RsiW-degrading membrane proteinase PrsW (M82 family)